MEEPDKEALFDMAASALEADVDRVQYKLSAARAGLAAGTEAAPIAAQMSGAFRFVMRMSTTPLVTLSQQARLGQLSAR